MRLGIDRLLIDTQLRSLLHGYRLAILAHPASMTSDFVHSVDALIDSGIKLTAAFGPQHGIRGDKQDNMMETDDMFDAKHHIPVFSLYGKVRRPTPAMLAHFDLILIDVQDVGCRIYTFLTTLFYLLEACAEAGKHLWVLDRPNPVGRPVDGFTLQRGFESFVGGARIPMRHGLTSGEAARWYTERQQLELNLKIVAMEDYDPTSPPGLGWPLHELPWVNPSPNMASLNAARAYAGTVLLEGTTLSEGRGTTRPLEIVGAPDIEIDAVLNVMQDTASTWLKGCKLRPCYFEPTFHKYAGQLCRGFQIHTDHPSYDHRTFKSFRLIALFLKALRKVYPHYEIWRDFDYEYVKGRLPIDTINGGSALRAWVDNLNAGIEELATKLTEDENAWREGITPYFLY